jgi:hypothetical protein
MAVLADTRENWRPAEFSYSVLGCRQSLQFPIVKLLDLRAKSDELAKDKNPFALLTLAHFATQDTKHDHERRMKSKLELYRLYIANGFSENQARVHDTQRRSIVCR